MSETHPALVSYQADAVHSFPPPPVGDLIARGRRRARRRVAALTAIAAAALTVSVAAVVDHRDRAQVLPADNLESVDWTHASIVLPSSGGQGCPSGKQQFRPGDAGDLRGIAKVGDPGGKSLAILPGARSYGDLTGDGVPEVVLPVWCSKYLEQTFGDSGAQLLAVSRHSDGTLAGLGYLGPVGAHYPSFRIANGQLITQVEYQTLGEGATVYSIYAPAHSRTYAWNGTRFTQIAGRTTPLVLAPDKEPEGSPARLPALLDTRGIRWCPAARVRFAPDSATVDGATYTVTDNVQQTDLDRDGNDELLVEISCHTASGTANSIYLLGQADDEFTTRDVPFANDGRYTIENWHLSGTELSVTFHKVSAAPQTMVMTWNGSQFEPSVGEFRQQH